MSENKETKGAEGGSPSEEEKREDGGTTDSKTEDATPGKDEKRDGEMSMFDAFAISLGLKDEPKVESLLDTVDFNGIIKYIKDSKATNIITMAGAGISTSAGIPDFRSPGTGLYDNLQKYNLPDPTAVFAIDYFKENPEPFFMLSRELWPGIFKPTTCHYFIRLLHEKGLLLRHYTQNIDTLESVAGLEPEMCIEAHGHFRTGHCIECEYEYSQDWMRDIIMKPAIPKCESCEGLVKPDIVFFGEALPARFGRCSFEDFKKCDLLIIMGTSLVVQPFASLANKTLQQVPRLYINLENSCPPKLDPIMSAIFGSGFDFDGENNYRDVFWQGTCDDGCQEMADALGWGEELKTLVKTEHAKIEAANPQIIKPPSMVPVKTGRTSTAQSSKKNTDVTPKKEETLPKKAEATSTAEEKKKTGGSLTKSNPEKEKKTPVKEKSGKKSKSKCLTG